jgi:flagellar FliL protein
MEGSSMMAAGSTAKATAETKQKTESKPTVENKPAVETKGKSRAFWVLIGFVALVAIAGGTVFLTSPSLKGARGAIWMKSSQSETDNKEHVKATLPLDPFLVNLADTDQVRFVKTTFQLGLAEVPKEEGKDPVTIAAIRDSIISLLSSKKAEQVLTPEGKETLRQEIRSRVNALSPKTKVLEVYIVDFVVQL